MSTPLDPHSNTNDRDNAIPAADATTFPASERDTTTPNTAGHHSLAGPPALPLEERRLVDDNATPETFDQASVLTREQEQFGGIKFGAAFFGWLTATGLAVILIAILAGAGVAFGLTDQSSIDAAKNSTGTAKTVGLVGGIVLLVVLLVAYYCGGYVAGRMARFNGAKQGLAVWIWAIITIVIIALIGWIAGSQYNILARLNLPRIPVDEGTVTSGGLIAAAAAILAALLGAILGGIAGTRYHRRIDRAGFTTPDTTTR